MDSEAQAKMIVELQESNKKLRNRCQELTLEAEAAPNLRRRIQALEDRVARSKQTIFSLVNTIQTATKEAWNVLERHDRAKVAALQIPDKLSWENVSRAEVKLLFETTREIDAILREGDDPPTIHTPLAEGQGGGNQTENQQVQGPSKGILRSLLVTHFDVV